MADDPEPELVRPTYVRRLRRWRFAMILAVLALAVVVAAAAGWRFARTESAPSNGPVIVVSIDSLRADHLAIYGYNGVKTPAIDALAAEGVAFDRAYAHSPQTFPSSVSILSGQLPFENGVRDDVGFRVRSETRLLPQMLKAGGYKSGAIVSSYLLRKETGLAPAFDFYDADMPAPTADFPLGQTERPGEDSVAAAQKWIASLRTAKFFLFLHLNEPHAPYAPPERFASLAPYDGEIAHTDEVVGRFMKWLRGRGLYDRATIVVVGNHGESLGAHGEQEHGLFIYDETLRVPLVVKLPRDVNHGHRVALPVQHIDLVPTILDLLDLPKAAGLRGRSLRGLLEGRVTPIPAQPIYAESFCARYRFGWSGLQGVIDGNFRFIEAPREELYDLAQDASEDTNIAAAQPATTSTMRTALEQLFAGARGAAVPAPVPFEERDRLASLGDVSLPAVEGIPDGGKTDPKDQVSVYEKCRDAMRLAGQHRGEDAAVLFREAIAHAPTLAGVWLQFGAAMERVGRPSDAVEAYKQTTKLAQGKPAGLAGAIGATRVLIEVGKLDEAKAEAAETLERAPAFAHEMLARIALARSDASEARKQADLAHQADPTLPMPLVVQAMLLSKAGKYEEAIASFEQALQAAAERPEPIRDLHYGYAEALGRLDRFGDAETQFKEEIRLFPHSIAPRVSLAMLYRAQRRTDEAGQAIQDLLTAAPTAEGYLTAARLWTIVGDKDRATATRAEAKARFGREALATRTPQPQR